MLFGEKYNLLLLFRQTIGSLTFHKSYDLEEKYYVRDTCFHLCVALLACYS